MFVRNVTKKKKQYWVEKVCLFRQAREDDVWYCRCGYANLEEKTICSNCLWSRVQNDYHMGYRPEC